MASDATNRRLAAILSADAVGYSRLMAADEEATVRAINDARAVMSRLTGEHHGRVVDSPGDNLLAEFPSALDAARCAVEIQKSLTELNEAAAPDRRMPFRMGLHLGDVLTEAGRIYGDGVNIAARLESLAEPGGVCVSAAVLDQVQGKIDLETEDLGEQTVKNIPKPVRVFRVRPAQPPAAVPAPALPDKPSIAVLPFTNMSGDPEQEYFADGITEDLITSISRIPGLFVISRNSSFTYKGKPARLNQVGRELGVRYVLEGSVRKSGDRVRVTAQLIDAGTDRHLWGERYDRQLEDIFAMQDEVTRQIVSALEINLGERGGRGLLPRRTDNLEAYDHLLRGFAYMIRTTKETNRRAREMLDRAIELDPGLAQAYSLRAMSRIIDRIFQWSTDPEILPRSFSDARKAVELDDSLSTAHAMLGLAYTFTRQYEEGLAEARKGVALNPNDAEAQLILGNVYIFLCEPEKAIPHLKQALRLDPTSRLDTSRYRMALANAYRMLGRFEEALHESELSLNHNPDFLSAHLIRAVTLIELGREADARRAAAEIKRVSPEFSTDRAPVSAPPYRDPEVLERMLTCLRKAGLE